MISRRQALVRMTRRRPNTIRVDSRLLTPSPCHAGRVKFGERALGKTSPASQRFPSLRPSRHAAVLQPRPSAGRRSALSHSRIPSAEAFRMSRLRERNPRHPKSLPAGWSIVTGRDPGMARLAEQGKNLPTRLEAQRVVTQGKAAKASLLSLGVVQGARTHRYQTPLDLRSR